MTLDAKESAKRVMDDLGETFPPPNCHARCCSGEAGCIGSTGPGVIDGEPYTTESEKIGGAIDSADSSRISSSKTRSVFYESLSFILERDKHSRLH